MSHRTLTLTTIDISELARWALEEHGLASQGWRFGWDRAVRRAGACHYGDKRITLSSPIFQIEKNREDALDTILHEVAHALAGRGAGHGATWKMIALDIGAQPRRCHTLTTPQLSVVGTCACGPKYQRTRLPGSGRKYTCRICSETVVWESLTDAGRSGTSSRRVFVDSDQQSSHERGAFGPGDVPVTTEHRPTATGSELTIAAIEGVARSALADHGLDALGWTFAWEPPRRRAACCNHAKREIVVSEGIVTMTSEVDDAREVILHAVAHALAGPEAGHREEWRRTAAAIGATRSAAEGPDAVVLCFKLPTAKGKNIRWLSSLTGKGVEGGAT
jgi:predicted SprT family Zn-dependent metalloprotease